MVDTLRSPSLRHAAQRREIHEGLEDCSCPGAGGLGYSQGRSGLRQVVCYWSSMNLSRIGLSLDLVLQMACVSRKSLSSLDPVFYSRHSRPIKSDSYTSGGQKLRKSPCTLLLALSHPTYSGSCFTQQPRLRIFSKWTFTFVGTNATNAVTILLQNDVDSGRTMRPTKGVASCGATRQFNVLLTHAASKNCSHRDAHFFWRKLQV